MAAFLLLYEAVAAYLPIMHVEAAEGGGDAKLERDDGKMDHDLRVGLGSGSGFGSGSGSFSGSGSGSGSGFDWIRARALG